MKRKRLILGALLGVTCMLAVVAVIIQPVTGLWMTKIEMYVIYLNLVQLPGGKVIGVGTFQDDCGDPRTLSVCGAFDGTSLVLNISPRTGSYPPSITNKYEIQQSKDGTTILRVTGGSVPQTLYPRSGKGYKAIMDAQPLPAN